MKKMNLWKPTNQKIPERRTQRRKRIYHQLHYHHLYQVRNGLVNSVIVGVAIELNWIELNWNTEVKCTASIIVDVIFDIIVLVIV